jgi:predicted MPP superfamily phosphohydrolase
MRLAQGRTTIMAGFLHYLNTPEWRRQQRWRKAVWTTMSRVGLTGMHALPLNRRWIDIQRRPMPLVNLDPAYQGMKIVQISDLHYSPVVWQKYLEQYLAWVNNLRPDLVVVTGDLITGGYRYAQKVSRILSSLQAPHGVICTLGNHDYSIYGKKVETEGERRANYLERSLKDHGMIVLRNENLTIRQDHAKRPLTIVGLDDAWSGHSDPDAAFAGVEPSQSIICLNHNPADCLQLMQYPWQWMLSGHTHGRQVATSPIGRRFYAHHHRHYTHGYYTVKGRHLYVNRGLSYGQRVLDWCRPEITVFKLAAADANPAHGPAVEGTGQLVSASP